MKRSWVFSLVLASLLALPSGSPLQAAEPFAQFLDGLRTLGYHDQAVAYLEQMRASPLISEELKQTIPYELGATLMAQADQMRNPLDRERLWDEAAKHFQQFVTATPNHPLAATANGQLAKALIDRAKLAAARANLEDAENPDALLQQSRQLLTQAGEVIKAATTQYRAELAEFKKSPPTTPEAKDRRMALYRALYPADLMGATVLYETAKTYKPDSAEFKDNMQKAAVAFGEMYKAHSKRNVGLYALLYEGRCYQELGDRTKALGIFNQLITDLPDSPAARPLKITAMRSALECWLQEKLFNEAVEKATPFVATARGQEATQPDWLAMKYMLASAAQQHAAALPMEEDARRKELLKSAHGLATDVVKVRGEFQDKARELLAAMGESVAESTNEPTTFEAAFERGQTAMQFMTSAADELKDTTDEGQKTTLSQQVFEKREEAIKYVQLALQLTNPTAPTVTKPTPEQVAKAHYVLTYLYYTGGHYWEAAAVGEFAARKFPKIDTASAAANIGLAALRQLHQASPTDNAFETHKVLEFADYISQAWPGTDAADLAINVMLLMSIQSDQLDKLPDYVERISKGSSRRAEAEVMVGQAIWSAYAKKMRLPEDERPNVETLNSMISSAEQYLKSGIEGMRKAGKVTTPLAFASLSLAQIYVDTAQPDLAIALLEDAEIGPLALVDAKNPAVSRAGYDSAAYMAALRAYIGVEPQQFDKAEQLLTKLREAAGNDPKQLEILTLRLMAMGQAIETQLDDLRSRDEQKKVDAVSKGFDLFLDSVAKQDASFQSLNWVASSYKGLAAGLSRGEGALPPQAVTYFDRAVAAYQKALAKAPSPEVAQAVQVSMAEAYRKQRKYDEAIDALAVVLKQKANMITAQIEAAYTYQEWARVRKEPKLYDKAIAGDRSKAVWGWARIAATTAPLEKFRDIYHEARYNSALCRYEAGVAKNRDKSMLEMAMKDISVTLRFYPDMGGEKWVPKYDSLCKDIQKGLNQKPEGLEALRKAINSPPSDKVTGAAR